MQHEKLRDLRPTTDSMEPYQRAFVHKSYCASNSSNKQKVASQQRRAESSGGPGSQAPPLQPESNERLEWLCDSVLQLFVSEHLLQLERQTEAAEVKAGTKGTGDLTTKRSGLVRNNALGPLMQRFGWDLFLLLGPDLEARGERANMDLQANCLEALVGAVYEDLGHAACKCWVEVLLFSEDRENWPIEHSTGKKWVRIGLTFHMHVVTARLANIG